MTRATELLEEAENLVRAIKTSPSSIAGERESKSNSEARFLIDREIQKLKMLIAGQSAIPEPNVYLSVSSLNKGLIEVGGSWRETPHLVGMANALTQKAYSFYKQTRPPLS